MHAPSQSAPDISRLLVTSWNIIEQSPPPSLREILGAYKAKGDGDRDMLLAMLNAKSAEDQRLAAVASLHRTLLDLSSLDHAAPSSSSQSLLPPSSYNRNSRYTPYPADIHVPRYPPRDPQYHSRPSAKRRRSSRSPPSHSDARPSSHDFPPSPYSSSRSGSEEYSPRSRASMAIGSLLSSGPPKDSVSDDSQGCDRSRIPC
ncbi:hypothetical protein EDC04DRAFT_2638250 [Pisolithus marmoratus]|nr:hypothetical protein EDC04DRAFT_2638250 [Pisolithus marmoratus]